LGKCDFPLRGGLDGKAGRLSYMVLAQIPEVAESNEILEKGWLPIRSDPPSLEPGWPPLTMETPRQPT